MKREPLVSSNNRDFNNREKIGETQMPRRTSSPLAWWYSWTAPAEPGRDVSLEQRENYRRGRLASIILLMMFFTVIAFIPLTLSSARLYSLPIVLSLLGVCGLAIFLNQRGHVTVVGVFIVASLDLALVLIFWTAPTLDLNMDSLTVFDLFILSELMAVSILPAGSVFVVALLNCLYIVLSILLMPHAPDLARQLAHSLYSVLIRPVALQVLVALVTYLWVRNAQDAIKRADRAEFIAQLEHTIAEQKRELDFGIEQLLQTLVQAANGDVSVRSPISQEHMLWQVAISLNTLLARLQRSGQSDQELQQIKTEFRRIQGEHHQIKAEIGWIISVLRDAKNRSLPLPRVSRVTIVEPLYRELSGFYLVPPQSGPKGPSSQS